MKEIIQDERLLALAPSDRWFYIAYMYQLGEVQERGIEAVLGITPEEHIHWRERLVAAHLLPRSFS